jgi:hypothetical protein
MKKLLIVSLIAFAAQSTAIAHPQKPKRGARHAPSNEGYTQCVSSGGKVAWVAPHYCPFPGDSFDDFKADMERRVGAMRAGY